jgi:ubiquitin carboxyl-terminal hydrolase 10
VVWASLTNSSVPSSSVTETTDTPTQAGSPASSHTSLSVASTKDGKDVGSSKEVDVMSAEEETSSNIPASAEKTIVVPTTSTAPTPSTPDVPPLQVAPPPTATSAAPPLPPAPPKKSWASLLRPSTSSSSVSASAGPSRNALPTSSVVGISIPAASTTTQDAALHVSPSRRSELVRLLTSGPGVAHTTAISYAGSAATTTTNLTPSTKIRPRGLINSGNMCFANSVLQIMVYCPPFHRLFAELGKVLGGVGLGGISGVTSGNGAAAEASAYPLVEATVDFLKEFVVDDDRSKDLKDPKGKANANVNGKVVSGSASGSGSPSTSRTSSSRGGKGKERERGDSVNDASGGAVGRREDDDGWTESFLPTYVYDAMKVKKRFEHMRVSSFVSSSSVLLSFLLSFLFIFLFF